MSKKAIVFGAGGFIGSHIVKHLKSNNYWVKGVDLKYPKFSSSSADEFFIGDCRNPNVVNYVINEQVDEIYQLAADMGGMGFIGVKTHDADIISNNVKINLNVLDAALKNNCKKIFYSSSACVYNEMNQMDTENPDCREDTVYPAQPDTEYGWEKLFSERLYLAYNNQYGMENRIARFHNIFGEYGSWYGGREKAIAAICRKVAEATDGGSIEIWGDGKQTRSFLHIDECVEGIMRLMNSDFSGPVNIGSEESISINELVGLVCNIANKNLNILHVDGPQGVRGRNSNNDLIREKLNWSPSKKLEDGLRKTYDWISEQVRISEKK